ncbi:MAG TPA: sigma-70 family RNA polymerase sigma factor [Ktedonobacterales bacterium]|nr:sigma-70 family RNA polymerase sigma factor [Ktedonobacterales bacterium]
MPTTEPEAALVERAIRRDAEAFGALYDRYFDRVYRYARLRVGNAADAEDVAAAVFLSAWRAIDRFSPKHDASFAGWLFRLAHNAVVDRYRRARDDVSLDAEAPRSEEVTLLANPESLLEWRLTVDELRHALAQLTEGQREVVLLRFVEGLSAREVGDILGKQEGTVRGMQFRAIEALRRILVPQRGGSSRQIPPTKAGGLRGTPCGPHV